MSDILTALNDNKEDFEFTHDYITLRATETYMEPEQINFFKKETSVIMRK